MAACRCSAHFPQYDPPGAGASPQPCSQYDPPPSGLSSLYEYFQGYRNTQTSSPTQRCPVDTRPRSWDPRDRDYGEPEATHSPRMLQRKHANSQRPQRARFSPRRWEDAAPCSARRRLRVLRMPLSPQLIDHRAFINAFRSMASREWGDGPSHPLPARLGTSPKGSDRPGKHPIRRCLRFCPESCTMRDI